MYRSKFYGLYSTCFDNRRKNENDIYPVKLRITYHRVQKYYSTGYKMNEADFAETLRNPPAKRLKNRRMELDHIELKARKIVSTMDDRFSFTIFEEKFMTAVERHKTIQQFVKVTRRVYTFEVYSYRIWHSNICQGQPSVHKENQAKAWF